MPAVSKKQQRFMAMCAHNPGAAKGRCPSKKVSQEFSHMGKRKHPKKNQHGYY